MAYNETNENYLDLAEDEKALLGLDRVERCEAMEKVLADLADDELMGMFREQNCYDGSYEFSDYWDMNDFLSMMMEGKRGEELVEFVMEVVNAVNDYGNDDYKGACWGYFDGYTLEIKDEADIIEEARADYLLDLAECLVDDLHHIDASLIPHEVDELLDLWNMEDDGEFAYEDGEDDDEGEK